MLSLELHTEAFPRATEVDWIYVPVKAILWDSVRAGEKKADFVLQSPVSSWNS